MPCASLRTGQEFLSTTLLHVDCQARTIGAYGYAALSDPNSVTVIALSGLLTILVAWFGIRLMLGYSISGGDVVGEVVRVGIVLTLALSWPAWRTLAYDLVLNSPNEIASVVGGASGLPGNRNDMIARLQDADDGIVAVTAFGSGRLSGDIVVGKEIGNSPRGIALSDQFALGAGRSLFLASTIGSITLVRLGAGILLAIAPLMAGLLLFSPTAALFVGWLRALAFCALGNLALLIVQGTQLILLYPWINDVLQQRGDRIFTPSAPTELFVLSLGFAVVTAGILLLTAKLTFLPSSVRLSFASGGQPASPEMAMSRQSAMTRTDYEPAVSRAARVSESVATVMRREEGVHGSSRSIGNLTADRSQADTAPQSSPSQVVAQTEALGTSFRRMQRRSSAAATKRDQTQ